jgi:RL domain
MITISLTACRSFATEKRNFTSFDSMMETRRMQAKKSVLIQVYSGYSCNELTDLCNEFGTVKDTFYYSTRNDLVSRLTL